jgi:hypothetical protein
MRATEFIIEANASKPVYHGNQGGIHGKLIAPMWWTENKDDAIYYATQGGSDGIVYTATLDCKKPYIVTAQDEANTLLQDYKNLIDQGYDSIYDPEAGDWIPFHSENIHITDEESYDGDEESDDDESDDEELYEISPDEVNNTIQQTGAGKWVPPGGAKKVPKGATGSVWQHLDDPDKVVKVVGGGRNAAKKHHLDSTVAFVDFLVHNGYKSTHLPIVHGIDVGSDVVQVRMERLYPINTKLGDLLYDMSYLVSTGWSLSDNRLTGKNNMTTRFNDLVKKGKIDPNKNSVESIEKCIELLDNSIDTYKNKYKLPNLSLDLHSGNWLQRSDGTIVAADPWYSGGAWFSSGSS